MADLQEFFVKYAKGLGMAAAEELKKEIITISSRQYPPASLAGQAPARRTGTFVDSIVVVPTSYGARLTIEVPGKAPYPFFLQYGTKRMKARPFLDIAKANIMKRKMSWVGKVKKWFGF